MPKHTAVFAQDIINIKPTAPPGLENIGSSLILAVVILVLTIVMVKAAKAFFTGVFQSPLTVILVFLGALAGLIFAIVKYWSVGSTEDVPLLSSIGELVRSILFYAALILGGIAGVKRWE